MHTDAAFAAGASGKGITVAVIDSGVDPTQRDLVGAVSSDSTDIVSSRNQPVGLDQHATFVAGIIASRSNGFGTVGVAFNSQILSIRANTGNCTGADTSDDACSFSAGNLANALDYARTHGARVVNLSVGGDGPLGSDFEAALSRAVNAGMAITISAGNDGGANPEWPAQYATDVRYLGSIAAVGAVDSTKTLASFSNKAGLSAPAYVVAPGVDIVTNCDGTSCWEVSGTSFAAPHVAGAVALMMDAFPNLSAKEALAILFATADDLGTPLTDTVYGQGLIDLQRAFQPVGTLSIAGTTQVPAAMMEGSSLGSAFGDAVARTPVLTTLAYDAYKRAYKVNLAEGYPDRRHGIVGGAVGPIIQDASVEVNPVPGVRMRFSGGVSDLDPPAPDREGPIAALTRQRSDLNVEVGAGRFSFQAWRGQGGMAPAAGLEASYNAFASMADPVRAARGGYSFGMLTLSAEAGSGGQYPYFGMAELKPASYALGEARIAKGSVATVLSAGRLTEPQGPLGSLLPGGTAFSLPAGTTFGMIHTDWAVTDWLALSGEAGLGRTSARGTFLSLTEPALSSNWRVVARFGCIFGQLDCTGLQAEVAQPTRIEQGVFSTTLADIPAAYDDPLSYSVRRFSAAPSGREIDLRFGVNRASSGVGLLGLQLITVFDQDNRAAAPVNLGLVANWRTRF